MERFSRKRMAILQYLASVKTHPDAETVYAALQPDFPELSLATVYRNLAQLVQSGLVRSVGTVNGKERYDAAPVPHPHAVCLRCGRVIDLVGFDVPVDTLAEAEEQTGFRIFSAAFRLEGVCADCRKKDEC